MPYNAVREFEERIAAYAGAKYGVAVESGSAALFLSCLYKKVGYTSIPKRTYPSVPCAIINAGGVVGFREEDWQGVYSLSPYDIVDGALRFRQGMFEEDNLSRNPSKRLHCLSFHIKKHLPIGRGGMILTNDYDAARWLKKARFDGREELPLHFDSFTMTGWNMYLQPEQASRGLQLFEIVRDQELPDLTTESQGYPDLSRYPVYGAVDLTMRAATMADAADLLRWKNEADTRVNSIVTTKAIRMVDHEMWLASTLADPSVQLFIIGLGGESIGDLRLNRLPVPIGGFENRETEVSIRMDKKFRGKGLATRAIGTVQVGGTLIAKIVSTNLASMRVFIANGYRPYFLRHCLRDGEAISYYVFQKENP